MLQLLSGMSTLAKPLFLVRPNVLVGYIDATGRYVIEPKFQTPNIMT